MDLTQMFFSKQLGKFIGGVFFAGLNVGHKFELNASSSI
jgi:hypothetical protein